MSPYEKAPIDTAFMAICREIVLLCVLDREFDVAYGLLLAAGDVSLDDELQQEIRGRVLLPLLADWEERATEGSLEKEIVYLSVWVREALPEMLKTEIKRPKSRRHRLEDCDACHDTVNELLVILRKLRRTILASPKLGLQ